MSLLKAFFPDHRFANCRSHVLDTTLAQNNHPEATQKRALQRAHQCTEPKVPRDQPADQKTGAYFPHEVLPKRGPIDHPKKGRP